MPAETYKSITKFLDANKNIHMLRPIYLTSGGFDPMHIGHLRCIQETVRLAEENFGTTVIVVNGDGFLDRKKGYSFMQESDRMEIIAGIHGVDNVVLWDDGTQTVVGAIEKIKPDFFTKGGDRTDATNVPEFDICDSIGCEVLFNIGGGKIRASSDLIENSRPRKTEDGEDTSHI